VLGVGRDDAAVGQHDLGAEQRVERQAGDSAQRTVAAAQGQPDHADGAHRAGSGRVAGGRRGGHDIGRGGAAGDVGHAIMHRDGAHRPQVDHKAAGPDGTPGPVVTAAQHGRGQRLGPGPLQRAANVVSRTARQHERCLMRHGAVPQECLRHSCNRLIRV
jgi:hypothetical protein